MPIRFPCTACGQLLGIATRKVGTEINCPTCGLAVIVPNEEQAKLLRQQSREIKQIFPSSDTPPEISIPRESHEAFDGGLESFLTLLEAAPTTSKPKVASAPSPFPAPPPAKPAAPIPPPASTVAPKPAARSKASNDTHALPASPAQPAVKAAPPAAKPPAPPVAAQLKQPPPPVAQAVEIPLAFEDPEVSVLSAADLLELAEEPLKAFAPLPPAKAPATPPPSLPAAKQPVAPPPKPPAAPISKPVVAPPPAPFAAPAPTPIPESVPLVESISPPATDFGFDFSSHAPAKVAPRKAEPALAPAAKAKAAPVTIPTPPFDNAVWISRRAIYTHVAILVLVSVATFLIGWISGGAGARTPEAGHDKDPMNHASSSSANK